MPSSLSVRHRRDPGDGAQGRWTQASTVDGILHEIEVKSSILPVLIKNSLCLISDTILGLPFNIASYAMLTHIVAAMVNMVPHEVIYFGADVHMYNNHVKSDELKVLLQREPSPAPHFELKKIPKDVDAMGALEWGTDVLVGDYHPQGKLKFELST